MKRTLGQKRRLGGAVVEMAIVLPLLLTMLLGIIEFGYAFTVRQALVQGAREGARLAALPGDPSSQIDDEIRARVAEHLSPLGLTTQTVTIDHATETSETEVITVTIPYADVTLVGDYFGVGAANFDLVGSCAMRKEGTD